MGPEDRFQGSPCLLLLHSFQRASRVIKTLQYGNKSGYILQKKRPLIIPVFETCLTQLFQCGRTGFQARSSFAGCICNDQSVDLIFRITHTTGTFPSHLRGVNTHTGIFFTMVKPSVLFLPVTYGDLGSKSYQLKTVT